MIGGMSDLTERRRLEDQVLRSQRLDSLGTLAGGIAHDLNNVFTPILFSTQLLREERDPDEVAKNVTLVESCALRAMDSNVKIIGSSGFANRAAGSSDLDLKHFVGKPYSASTLLSVIRQVLDE